jgi:nitroreductase
VTAVPAQGDTLGLDAETVLTTTRAVRKRLDYDRPVPRELIRQCVAIAMQAPAGSNLLSVHFVVVTDAAKRAAIGTIYGEIYAKYMESPNYTTNRVVSDPVLRAQNVRVASSGQTLARRMGEAPALVLACNVGADRRSAAAGMGNVLPATWSFMLAARNRGLGTAWTSMHLSREQEVAEIVGIPYDTVAQAVLTPVAYTIGTDFRPAKRPDADEIIHWDAW